MSARKRERLDTDERQEHLCPCPEGHTNIDLHGLWWKGEGRPWCTCRSCGWSAPKELWQKQGTVLGGGAVYGAKP